MSNYNKLDVKNSSSQQLAICNRSTVAMGAMSWRGGSSKVARPIISTRLKMEDVCILCNVIEILWWRKVTKTKKKGGGL